MDVTIVCEGPAGIGVAIGTAINSAKTLLIEKKDF